MADFAPEGFVAPGFEPVRDAFVKNFAERGEVGASVAAFRDGQAVVDLWGGESRPGMPWDPRTVVPVFSVSKGIAAIVLTRLRTIGAIDPDMPVAEVWPEFAAGGKESVTLRHVFSHTAGLPWFDHSPEIVSFDSVEGWASRDYIEDCLAAQTPLWEPGTKVGYHSFTFGWLADGIVRRATGRTIADFLRTDLADPLDADMIINYRGDPRRVATLVPPQSISDERSGDSAGDAGRAFFSGPRQRPMWEIVATPEYWALGGPSAGGVGNARGIAKLYALLTTDGTMGQKQYLDSTAIADHTREHFSGRDVVFGFESRTGLGFGLATSDGISFGPFTGGAGFSGMGGALGFADRATGISFGYAMNQMRIESYGNVSTCAELLKALHGCL